MYQTIVRLTCADNAGPLQLNDGLQPCTKILSYPTPLASVQHIEHVHADETAESSGRS